jgi:hypothetical protein
MPAKKTLKKPIKKMQLPDYKEPLEISDIEIIDSDFNELIGSPIVNKIQFISKETPFPDYTPYEDSLIQFSDITKTLKNIDRAHSQMESDIEDLYITFRKIAQSQGIEYLRVISS